MLIPVDSVELEGVFDVPLGATGIVMFAHGSGSSRLRSCNSFVARALRQMRIGTLLFDLLTEDEELDRKNVFDIDLLARRLDGAVSWVRRQPRMSEFAIGYFGAGTGTAAALVAAADDPAIAAIVSRAGRPDLAKSVLARVTAPTLLIVGGEDDVAIDPNRNAYERLRCEKCLSIVPGAGHVFAEPGKLEEVAHLAANWFLRYLGAPRATVSARPLERFLDGEKRQISTTAGWWRTVQALKP